MKKPNELLMLNLVIILSIFLIQPVSATNETIERNLLLEACSLLDAADKEKQCIATVKREIPIKSSQPSTTKEIITFKGIPFDKPNIMNDLRKLCNSLKSNQPDEYDKDGDCNFEDDSFYFDVIYGTLTGTFVKDRGIFARFVTGKDKSLKSVTMRPYSSQIPALVVVLSDKYGTPDIETEIVSNKLGAQFDNDIYTWEDKAGNRIKINSIYGKVDDARIEINSASVVAENLKNTDELLNKGKDNL